MATTSCNIYTEASAILLTHRSGSLKSRIYSTHNAPQKSRCAPARLYALIMESLKYQDVLNEVIKNSGILTAERKLSPTVALLLLHDHLLLKPGKDCIALSANHPLKAAILRHKARLNAEFTRSRLRRGFPTAEALKEAAKSSENSASAMPRWVRVNTIKATVERVLSALPFSSFTRVDSLESLWNAPGTSPNRYHVDEHIPNLLAFPASLTHVLTSHHLYTSGALILQDKASCLPAYILNPPPGSYVVDACAAPGNKTTHLAAVMMGGCGMHGKGRITAFERDPRRSDVLTKMVNTAGATGVVEVRKASDFLKADPLNDSHLGYTTHLLLDPSCSGSGITAREKVEDSVTKFTPLPTPAQSHHAPSKKRKRASSPPVVEAENEVIPSDESATALATRLSTLSGFQLALLLHALRYPHAERITYSTCSIYPQENEHVIVAALLSPIAKERGWKLDTELCMLRGWKRRGILVEVEKKANDLLKPGESMESGWVEEVATGCIRCDEGDGTGGFFVACFTRGPKANIVAAPAQCRNPVKASPEPQGEVEEEYEEWGGISEEEEEGTPPPPPLVVAAGRKEMRRGSKKRRSVEKTLAAAAAAR